MRKREIHSISRWKLLKAKIIPEMNVDGNRKN